MKKAIDLKKTFRGHGYLIEESDHDTTNILCRHGHIYADGNRLVAALDSGSGDEICQKLRQCGEVIADGDDGELSVAFDLGDFQRVAEIALPLKTGESKPAVTDERTGPTTKESCLRQAKEREEFEALIRAEEDEPVDDESDLADRGTVGDYIGPVVSKSVILRRLRIAKDWHKTNRCKQVEQETLIACVNILRQSFADYSGWVARNRRCRISNLIDLVISDVEASPIDYQLPWQLDRFASGKCVKAAKSSREKKCSQCRKTFRPARMNAKYCGDACRNKAARRRRKALR